MIVVAYHVSAVRDWQDVVNDQIVKLQYSGLYDAAEAVYCFVSGQDADACVELLRSCGKKFQVVISCPPDTTHERLTLHGIMNPLLGAVKAETKVLYIHSDVVTRTAPWRYAMEYFLIKKWRDCVANLDSGDDTVGIFMQTEPKLHYSGNFWWARGSHLQKLPLPIGPVYSDPETWVCSIPEARYNCLFSCNKDMYYRAVPKTEYIDSA